MAKQIICPKCGYIFAKGAKQRDLTKHLKRKNPCPALKRRVIAVYNAKFLTFHPDNGSDIRRMLENVKPENEKKNTTNKL
ncbi:4316_t:CDS:2 [Entrophospora sp. SA101]|nr:14700_t:CDS:2 [Entrophospora sp. SA101]CAJ0753068.1 7023_t:CDS:2 [Entrophospora sp. SA101]CAJ0758384.1 4316_t:CDS:2 [Entrophospora sp. SA101]CAJ0853539.1 5049_t:CDS:2 [Entrophospora sp. SA101]CAJ0853561.1 5051_t:CDS:2 [Entrophospora sp. SA101]